MEKTDTKSLKQLQNEFKDKFNIDLQIMEDIFSRVDAWFTWNDKKYQVEVKRRRFDSDKYPTAIIDESKYDALVKRKAFLVCMYDDKWGICKNLESAYLKTTPVYCNKTTDWASDRQWSNKVELDLTKFRWYEYEENKR